MENQKPRSHVRLAASIILLVAIGASVIAAGLPATEFGPGD